MLSDFVQKETRGLQNLVSFFAFFFLLRVLPEKEGRERFKLQKTIGIEERWKKRRMVFLNERLQRIEEKRGRSR